MVERGSSRYAGFRQRADRRRGPVGAGLVGDRRVAPQQRSAEFLAGHRQESPDRPAETAARAAARRRGRHRSPEHPHGHCALRICGCPPQCAGGPGRPFRGCAAHSDASSGKTSCSRIRQGETSASGRSRRTVAVHVGARIHAAHRHAGAQLQRRRARVRVLDAVRIRRPELRSVLRPMRKKCRAGGDT